MSIELALTCLKICAKAQLDNQENVVETVMTLLLQRFTDRVQHSSLIQFGEVTVPVWITNQLALLEQLIKQCDKKYAASQPLQ